MKLNNYVALRVADKQRKSLQDIAVIAFNPYGFCIGFESPCACSHFFELFLYHAFLAAACAHRFFL